MKDQDEWNGYAARASGHGLRKRNKVADDRKALILELVEKAGAKGICAEDLEAAIGYARKGKGGGGVHRLIERINEGLIYSRATYRIGEIIDIGEHGRRKAFFRIVEAKRREVHFEKPLKP